MDHLVVCWQRRQKCLHRQLEMLLCGDLRLGEMRVGDSSFKDITNEAIEQVERQLADLDSLFERYDPQGCPA